MVQLLHNCARFFSQLASQITRLSEISAITKIKVDTIAINVKSEGRKSSHESTSKLIKKLKMHFALRESNLGN